MRRLIWSLVTLCAVTPLVADDPQLLPAETSSPQLPSEDKGLDERFEKARESLQRLSQEKRSELQEKVRELTKSSESLAARIREALTEDVADATVVEPLRDQLRKSLASLTAVRHELRQTELAELIREMEKIANELRTQEQQRDQLVEAQLEAMLRRTSPATPHLHATDLGEQNLVHPPDQRRANFDDASVDVDVDVDTASRYERSAGTLELSSSGRDPSAVTQLVDRWRQASDEQMQREIERQQLQSEIESAEGSLQPLEEGLARLNELDDAHSQSEVTMVQRDIAARHRSLRSLARQQKLLDAAAARCTEVRKFYAEAIYARTRQADHELTRAKSQLEAAQQRLELAEEAFLRGQAPRQIVIEEQAVVERAAVDFQVAVEQRKVVYAAAKLVRADQD